MMGSRRLARAAAASILVLAPVTAHSQLSSIRKAADTMRESLPSVESIFGNGPVITTGMEDALDGVSLLDDFKPASWSPLMEMPRAQDGTLLLVPGAYVGMLHSFCLQPGTHGPQRGEGYLHAQWEGPRAEIISTIVRRYGDQNEVSQQDTQKLLWAIIARADLRKANRDVQLTAARLLTPTEILELSGYSLNAVPAALARRVAQSAPDATRQILQSENQLRQMFQSTESQYAQLEQVAVNNGALPESEARYAIPWKRWSYHPAGFFIRYTSRPREYYLMRIEIYYPEKMEIRRDASGRIISIASASGGRFEPRVSSAAPLVLASNRNELTKRDVLLRAASRNTGDARGALMELATMDYRDIAAFQTGIVRVTRSRSQEGNRTWHLLEEAKHAALARYMSLLGSRSVYGQLAIERAPKPSVMLDGYAYVIEPVVESRMFMPGGFGPGGGGGVAPGQRQRLGPSLGMVGPPPALWGGPGGEAPDDALDRAEKATDMFNKMNALREFSFGSGALDKAAMGANTAAGAAPGGFGAATSPGSMLSAGTSAAFAAARAISNALGGGDAWLPSTGTREVGSAPQRQSSIIPVSRTSIRGIGTTIPGRYESDYRTLSGPRTIEFNSFRYPQNPAHADAINAMLRSTFRMATLLEAWNLAQQRLAAAVGARDDEWQLKQGLALIHLKRASGLAMIQVSEGIADARRTSPPGPLMTAEDVSAAQRDLRQYGYHPDVISVSQQLGMTGAEIDARKQRALALDPATVASTYPTTLQEVQDALLAYGKYLSRVPDVAAPWAN